MYRMKIEDGIIRHVYDDIIEAARRNGAEIITDLENNKEQCSFSLEICLWN